MSKMTTRLGVMSDLRNWSMYHANEHIIQKGSDEEFQSLVDKGTAIIDNAQKSGIDFDTKAYSGLYQSIDVETISYSRLSILLKKFPAISTELKFYKGSNHDDNRLVILEARFINSKNMECHVENIKQCFAYAASSGNMKAMLKSLELTREFFGMFDFYDEDVSCALSAMIASLGTFEPDSDQNKSIILCSALETFEPIRNMNPKIGSEDFSNLLRSPLKDFAEHIYPYCDFFIQSNNVFEEFFKEYDVAISDVRIFELLDIHKQDDNAFEYAIELTRLKFAKGDTEGYDKFFAVEWSTASEVAFYINGCLKESSFPPAILEAFGDSIFSSADKINKLKPTTLSKIIASLGKTEQGRAILDHAKKNRDFSKYIISSELDY